MNYSPGDKVWVYSNGSYYAGTVDAIGPKRLGLMFTTGSGKACIKNVGADAVIGGWRIVVPGTEPKPAGARSGGKPNGGAA